MRVDVAVVGSLNLDLVVPVERVPGPGETVLGGDLARHPGGKGANQAVAAGRLGSSTALVGRVGDDEAGRLLRASLVEAGVDDAAVVPVAGVPTGTALIAVERTGDNAIVVSPGANARLAADDVTGAGVVDEAAVVLAQLEVPLAAVAAAASAATGLVVLNPAPAQALPRALLDGVDVLVPNEHELGLLVGRPVDPTDTAAVAGAAAELAVPWVIVTLGARGAVVVGDDTAELIPAPRIDPVDTTAAGDAFCAALAGGLATGQDPVTAAAWAVRVGAATALRRGAQPSLPDRDEVDARLR